MPDVNALFARAEAAFAAGRPADARADLAAVERLAGAHPAVLHLVALVERRLGRVEAAKAAFEGALALAPADPQIHNNYANCLDAAGDAERALPHYERAIAAAPRFVDARLNRALLLQKLGRPAIALAELDVAAGLAAPGPRLLAGRGAVLRDLDRLDEAADAFDAALALEPTRVTALAGRARVALERGEDDAADRYRRALAALPDDPDLLVGLALALEAAGDASAIPLVERLVGERPGWAEGHAQLTRMRGEAGDGEDAARSYRAALAQVPEDAALHCSHWNALIGGERFAEVLDAIDTARAHLPEDPTMLLAEAVAASEVGQAARAEAAFARLDPAGPAALPLARHALRSQMADRAAHILEAAVRRDPADIAAWAYLSIAWRLLGDARAVWLCEQPGLVATRDLGYAPGELEALAAMLRTLHRARAHPLGQSLRGGTQTRGRLLARSEPLIVDLRRRLEDAIAAHAAALPPADRAHPLLRHRDGAFALAGSWSVRLQQSGFHVHHIHPQGLLSSAFYVALPDTLGDADTRGGWLDLGAPPRELGLDLPPLTSVEPRPGYLALFPSYLFHGTRPFATGERLTVAFDVQAK